MSPKSKVENEGSGKKSKRIEICGGIASGKTTLAQLLDGAGIKKTLEDFQSNPFWKLFYADPVAHAFETEITFLLQHYNQIKVQYFLNLPFACDFSLFLDRAYVDVTLKGSQRDAFLAVYDEVKRLLPPPALVVHLQCGAEEELRRIRTRARETEKSIEIDYLERLNEAVNHHVNLAKDSIKVLPVDSERKDFAHDQDVQIELVSMVKQAMRP